MTAFEVPLKIREREYMSKKTGEKAIDKFVKFIDLGPDQFVIVKKLYGKCLVAIICITVFLMFCVNVNRIKTLKYIEAGYTQSMVVGYESPIWVKN